MINLLYCGNKKAFDGILISLLSVIKHTKAPITCYILTMDLTDVNEAHTPITLNQKTYLDNMLKEVNKENNVVLIDITDLFKQEMINSVNLANFYTPYCLLRLFADSIKELPDKILYLDTDTMAHKDVTELYNIDVSNHEYGAVVDYLGKTFKNRRYINSGVLLMNLPMIRETKLFIKTRAKCVEKKMAFPDQDALNKFSTKKLFLPQKYNSQRRYYEENVIQHFCKSLRWLPFFHTINVKPWQVDEVHSKLKIFAFDDILEDYQKRIALMKGDDLK